MLLSCTAPIVLGSVENTRYLCCSGRALSLPICKGHCKFQVFKRLGPAVLCMGQSVCASAPLIATTFQLCLWQEHGHVLLLTVALVRTSIPYLHDGLTAGSKRTAANVLKYVEAFSSIEEPETPAVTKLDLSCTIKATPKCVMANSVFSNVNVCMKIQL